MHIRAYLGCVDSYLMILFRKHAITVDQLAAAAGVTRQGARNWWDGKSLPRVETLPDVLRLLRRYEPTLTLDTLLARQFADRRPRPIRRKP